VHSGRKIFANSAKVDIWLRNFGMAKALPGWGDPSAGGASREGSMNVEKRLATAVRGTALVAGDPATHPAAYLYPDLPALLFTTDAAAGNLAGEMAAGGV
jgi:hypothetical protein